MTLPIPHFACPRLCPTVRVRARAPLANCPPPRARFKPHSSDLLMLSTLLALCLISGAPGPDTIVVCPQVLRPALQPWIKHREQQGHSCRVIAGPTPEEI